MSGKPRILVLVRWKEPRSARKVAPPISSSVSASPCPAMSRTVPASAAETRDPCRLPDRRQADRGGDESLHETEQVGLDRDRQRDRHALRRPCRSRREGDVAFKADQARRRPGGKRRVEEAAPLLARFQIQFRGRRQRERELVDLFEGGAVARPHGAIGMVRGGWRRCAPKPRARRSTSQATSVASSVTSPASTAHSSVCE